MLFRSVSRTYDRCVAGKRVSERARKTAIAELETISDRALVDMIRAGRKLGIEFVLLQLETTNHDQSAAGF